MAKIFKISTIVEILVTLAIAAKAALLMMDNGKKCPPFLPHCLPHGYGSFYSMIDSHALQDIRILLLISRRQLLNIVLTIQ